MTFTPHLVPMNRGILSTAYCRLEETLPLHRLRALYRDFYKNERFVRLSEDIVPNPRYIEGSNYCDVGCLCRSSVPAGSSPSRPWTIL